MCRCFQKSQLVDSASLEVGTHCSLHEKNIRKMVSKAATRLIDLVHIHLCALSGATCIPQEKTSLEPNLCPVSSSGVFAGQLS